MLKSDAKHRNKGFIYYAYYYVAVSLAGFSSSFKVSKQESHHIRRAIPAATDNRITPTSINPFELLFLAITHMWC